MRRTCKWSVLVVVLGMAGAGCSTASAPPPAATSSNDCPVREVGSSQAKPVTLTVWAYNSEIDEMATRFNRAQDRVRVKVETKGNPAETAVAYLAAAASHRGVPDLVQLPGFATAAAIDTASVVAAQTCIDASGYDLGDFLPQTLATTNVAGTQWGMPDAFDDCEVFLYDKQAFARAGLDPERPPATVDELVSDARALASTGIAHPMGPLFSTDELILSGPLTDADSGHQGRPSRAAFDSDASRQVYRANLQMIDDGLAAPVPSDPQGDLKALSRGQLAMTIHPISDLKSVALALAQGQAPAVTVGVGPVPTAAGPGGVLARSNSLFLSKVSSPSVRAGAWTFITWLEAPAQQARGLQPSGAPFFPDRRSAAADPAAVDAFAKQPLLRATWDVLTNAKWAPIPALGPQIQVIAALNAVLKEVSAGRAGLDDALVQAARAVDSQLAAYNVDPLRYARCEFQPPDAEGNPPHCG